MKNSGIEFDTQTYIRKIQKENVYKLIQKGLSPQEIAKVLNIDEYKVKAHIKNLRDSGLEIHIDRKKVKRKKVKYQVDEIDKQIIELRKQGHTLDEIAELLGRAKITIAKRIQKMKVNNIEVPDATRRDYYEKLVRNNEMAKLYEDGMNSIDIAKEYGVSKSLVWNVVHEKGIKRQSKHIHSEETQKQIVDLYKKGFGIKELGMIFTISHGTISKILTENGVKAVWDRKIKKVVREKIVKLSEQGLSIEKIARKVGCSQVMVGRVLKRNEKTKCKYYLENVGKEKLINAMLKLRKSKNATDEQLAVIAEKYGVDIKDVLAVAKDREER